MTQDDGVCAIHEPPCLFTLWGDGECDEGEEGGPHHVEVDEGGEVVTRPHLSHPVQLLPPNNHSSFQKQLFLLLSSSYYYFIPNRHPAPTDGWRNYRSCRAGAKQEQRGRAFELARRAPTRPQLVHVLRQPVAGGPAHVTPQALPPLLQQLVGIYSRASSVNDVTLILNRIDKGRVWLVVGCGGQKTLTFQFSPFICPHEADQTTPPKATTARIKETLRCRRANIELFFLLVHYS